MKMTDNRNYLSDEGKVFVNKETKDIMGWGICLGDNDSIDNYDEVECPKEYKGNKAYDNTQRHLAAVEDLINKEDIENYDYKIGYPEQLVFN